MIDVENEIFNQVAKVVRLAYPNIYMSGEYVKSPQSFPCAFLVEVDNSMYDPTQTSSDNENHASVMYECNVYSNKKRAKKDECKDIIALIDKELAALGFSRIMLQPIPNMDDATIYRMIARYSAVVSKDEIIYRR